MVDMVEIKHVRIKEGSWLARLAARKLGVRQVALTLGDTIHLCRTSREEFLDNPRWVKHEMVHVEQFRHFGFWNFLGRYLWETVRKGYYMNRFEVEARSREHAE
jgi:Domain of unknown function (DUF4157)